MTFTIVVTGGREFSDRALTGRALNHVMGCVDDDITLVNGTARGADRLAAEVARDLGWTVIDVPAEWNRYGKSAGFRRNTLMLTDYHPDVLIAFPGGRGTAHTVSEAQRLGVPIRYAADLAKEAS